MPGYRRMDAIAPQHHPDNIVTLILDELCLFTAFLDSCHVKICLFKIE
jgi:hypothetical protein